MKSHELILSPDYVEADDEWLGSQPIARKHHYEGLISDLFWPYLRGRRRRGEITKTSQDAMWAALRSFGNSYGRRPVSRLSRPDILRWQEGLADLAPATRRRYFVHMNKFCDYLAEQGYVRRSPMVGLKAPRQPKTLPRSYSADQVQAALMAAEDIRVRLAVILMVQLGLRRKEVVGLNMGDIDLRHGTVRVVGKWDNERPLPITDEVREVLGEYLAQHPATAQDPLIRSYRRPHEGITANYLGALIAQCLYDAGVKTSPHDGMNGHRFRHTALTDMLLAGAHPRTVQAAAGHASLTTTEIYLPLTVEPLREAMNGRRYGKAPVGRRGAARRKHRR